MKKRKIYKDIIAAHEYRAKVHKQCFLIGSMRKNCQVYKDEINKICKEELARAKVAGVKS